MSQKSIIYLKDSITKNQKELWKNLFWNYIFYDIFNETTKFIKN